MFATNLELAWSCSPDGISDLGFRNVPEMGFVWDNFIGIYKSGTKYPWLRWRYKKSISRRTMANIIG